MQKIGHWLLEFDEKSYIFDNVYLYWVVGDATDEKYDTKSFCIGYDEDTDKLGFLSYIGKHWNQDIEIIETLYDEKYPWCKICLLSNINGGKSEYSEQYQYYLQFMSEVDITEVQRLIQKEIIDDMI